MKLHIILVFMNCFVVVRVFELGNYANSALGENFTRILQEKCKSQENFENVNLLPLEINTCLEAHVNYTQIQNEIQEAKKTGSMDEVFVKYCAKYPEIYTCIDNALETLKPCLETNEQISMREILNFVHILKEYACFKDGVRLAVFISQGGVECVEAKMEEVQMCLNETVDVRLNEVLFGTLAQLKFSEKDCSDLFQIRSCFHGALVKCKQNIPANVLEAFFKFLEKFFSCERPEQSSENNDMMYRIIILVVFFVIVVAMCYKLAT